MANAILSSMLSGALNSILGSPNKAIITIETATAAASASPAAGLGSGLANAAASAASTAASTALGSVSGLAGNTTSTVPGATGQKRLVVQYNPSSISIQANAESVRFQNLQQNLDNAVPANLVRPPSVVMSVELVFDDMNIADSFMVEKFTSGLSAQTVSNVVNAALGRTFSVQTQINAFIGLMQSDTTRNIKFQWADMSFVGEVTEAQAKYTMFSTSGRPVRGTVRLNITQQVDDKTDASYWDTAFQKFFANGVNEVGARSGLDKVKNLINIGF